MRETTPVHWNDHWWETMPAHIPKSKLDDGSWAGVNDRCRDHEDGLEVRSKQIADIADRCESTDIISLFCTEWRLDYFPWAVEYEKELARKQAQQQQPLAQQRFSWDVAGPTASKFEPDPDPARTRAMLADGFKTWEKSIAV